MFKLDAVLVAAAVALALPIAADNAPAPDYAQCGGQGWYGTTVCMPSSSCVAQSIWYSQCLPGVATTKAATTSKAATTTKALTTTTSKASTTSAAGAPSATGFVKTSGQKFTLNGAKYTLVGENAYWVGLMNYTPAQMNQAFAEIAATGSTTSRTLGFNDVISGSSSVAYYQSWNGSTPTVNTGANGLQNFDKVVAAAKANNIRLIVPLTNNWADYGGADVYVNQILGSGQPHDYFYTDAKVIAAYKNYIKAFVTRYKNEPTILAWELMNEPRCTGSTTATSGNCTVTAITNWAADISAYIKSIDSNHLVSVGDEGFFNEPSNSNFLYQGIFGIDNAALTNISTIDFGTFHMYPLTYGQTADPVGFGDQWIADHTALQKQLNKPVIMEEFGVTPPLDKATTYKQWYADVVTDGLAGDLVWQAGSNFTTNADDDFMVYPGDAAYEVLTEHAAELKARA